MPGRNVGRIDPGDQEPLIVRTPPETSTSAHFLGSNELGRAPGDVGFVVFWSHDEPVTVSIADTELAGRVIGDAASIGREARVEGDAGRRDLGGRAGVDVGLEQAATEREGDDPLVAVGGVGDDSAASFAGAFAASFLGCGEFDVTSSEELDRIDQEPRLRVGQVDLPQAVDRVIARRRTTEQDSLAVSAHDDGPRSTERESLGDRIAPGIAHGDVLARLLEISARSWARPLG